MNKKGFTVVELIVSFSLTAVITIFLVQIVMALNNIYNSSGIKTELLTKQSLISSQINKKFSDKKISSVTSCGNYCLKFNYSDKTSDTFKIDYSNNTLEFGNYKTDLPEDTYFKDVKVDIVYGATIQNNINNAILNIVIPIYNDKLKDEDFGVNIAYQFNTDNSNIEYVDFAGKGEYIVLNGDTEQTFNTQTAYVEQGYTIYDKNGNVIVGNVEVENPLTTTPYKSGNYKIKYSLKDNNNNIISQTTRSVTITPSTYEITNLVTNGSFEEGIDGWYNSSFIESSSEYSKTGKRSLKLTTDNVQSFPRFNISTDVERLNHIIYMRTDYYKNDASLSIHLYLLNSNTLTSWPTDAKSYTASEHNKVINAWDSKSMIRTLEYNYISNIMLAQGNDAGIGSIYYDDVIIVDLTETFGAGNEPSLEWCDENIYWFEGTTKINY